MQDAPSTSNLPNVTKYIVVDSSDDEDDDNESVVSYKANVKALKTVPEHTPTTSTTTSSLNRTNISNLAEVLGRYSVSDRIGAAIASATLADFGLLSNEDRQNIIDRSKIRRAREKTRISKSNQLQCRTIKSLYFDGRKDSTLAIIDNRRRKIMEEHIVLIEEPGENYIGHVSPSTGSAASIVDCINSFLDESSITLDELKVIGCDGTNTNIGFKGGIVALLENKLMRPLQRFICQLHANELPLRHLINSIDGDTTGPRGFSGPMGKELLNCEKKSVVSFAIIESEMPVILNADLSTDQLYLYEMCIAIVTGVCSMSLLGRNPGIIS